MQSSKTIFIGWSHIKPFMQFASCAEQNIYVWRDEDEFFSGTKRRYLSILFRILGIRIFKLCTQHTLAYNSHYKILIKDHTFFKTSIKINIKNVKNDYCYMIKIVAKPIHMWPKKFLFQKQRALDIEILYTAKGILMISGWFKRIASLIAWYPV